MRFSGFFKFEPPYLIRMLTNCFEIRNISKKGLPNYFLIKINPENILTSEIHPKEQKKGVKSIFTKTILQIF